MPTSPTSDGTRDTVFIGYAAGAVDADSPEETGAAGG